MHQYSLCRLAVQKVAQFIGIARFVGVSENTNENTFTVQRPSNESPSSEQYQSTLLILPDDTRRKDQLAAVSETSMNHAANRSSSPSHLDQQRQKQRPITGLPRHPPDPALT